MRMGVYGWGHAPSPARRDVLWDCLRGLGDTVVRLQLEPGELARSLVGLRGLELRSANRLVSSSTNWSPRESGPDVEGVWLYGDGPALHWRRTPALVLAPLVTPRADIPARSLLFFDQAGGLIQTLAPAGANTADALDKLIADRVHSRQDCLPVLDSTPDRVRAPDTAELGGLERLWCHTDAETDFARELDARGVHREALYERMGDQYAARVAPETLSSVPEFARTRGLPLVVTEVNRDSRVECRALPRVTGWRHTALVLELEHGWQRWRCDRLGSVWRVRRPGPDGIKTTLEVFDNRGELALMLGSDNELPWRRLLGDGLYPPVCG